MERGKGKEARRESFSEFYENWVAQLEEILKQLLRVSKDSPSQQEQEVLVSRVATLHRDYYTRKTAEAHRDVLPFFSPDWLSPLENAHLWMTGWKPSLMIQLVDSVRRTGIPSARLSGSGLSEDQLKKIEDLKVKIRMDEDKVEREMERQQVVIADRRVVDLARLGRRVRNGQIPATQVNNWEELTVKSVMSGLERVVNTADHVRMRAFRTVLEILNPLQCVDFLAAMIMLQIKMRDLGKKTEMESRKVDLDLKLSL